MHSTYSPTTYGSTSVESPSSVKLSKPSWPWWKLLTFGANGRYLLTIAIIWIRAAQTNAEPMSQWSASSWFLMTMPVWLPTALAVLVFSIWFGLWIWANASRRY